MFIVLHVFTYFHIYITVQKFGDSKIEFLFSKDALIDQKSTKTFMLQKISTSEMFLVHQISERSCDTEDWSNDAENSALLSQE